MQIYTWIYTVWDKKVPASENFEVEKALKFAKEMGTADFEEAEDNLKSLREGRWNVAKNKFLQKYRYQ